MDLNKMTRARAEQIVATTTDQDVLSELMKHPNVHVAQKVKFKRLSPEARRNATGIKHLGRILQAFEKEIQAKGELARQLSEFLIAIEAS